MATYLGTHGSKIQNYTTNPDNPNQGEVWYNETDNVLKFKYTNVAAAWSTANSLNEARLGIMSAINGTQNAALGYEGCTSSNYLTCTEEYDGTSWSVANTLITARMALAGAGTQAASIAFGGFDASGNLSCTEEYTITEGAEVFFNRDTCIRCVTGTCTQIS